MFFVVLFSLCLVACLVAWYRTHNSAWRTPALAFSLLILAHFLNMPGYIYATIVALGVIAVCVRIQRHRDKGTRVLHLTGLTVVVAAIVYTAVVVAHPFTTPAGTPDRDTVKALLVTKADYSCNEKAKFDIEALKDIDPDGRQRPDAISTPFNSTNPAKMVAEVEATNCTDQLYGSTLMNLIANKTNAANPWLKDFKGTDAGAINAAASRYIGRDKNHPTTKAQMNEWRAEANLVNTLLGRFTIGSVHTGQPVLSYHLNGTGSVNKSLPSVVAIRGGLDTRPALMLTLPREDGHGCLMVIGFNTDDKAPSEYPCPAS